MVKILEKRRGLKRKIKLLFRKGRQIRDQNDIAQLLSIGQKKIKVYVNVVLSTGSEIQSNKKAESNFISMQIKLDIDPNVKNRM